MRHFKELLAAAEAEAKVPRTTRSGKPYSAPSAASGDAREVRALLRLQHYMHLAGRREPRC